MKVIELAGWVVLALTFAGITAYLAWAFVTMGCDRDAYRACGFGTFLAACTSGIGACLAMGFAGTVRR